jgi:predicted nucleotidyltransferase
MLEDKWKMLIKETVRKYLGNDVRVFIFGSRAAGTNRKWSDVDVGVIAKEKIDGAKKQKLNMNCPNQIFLTW